MQGHCLPSDKQYKFNYYICLKYLCRSKQVIWLSNVKHKVKMLRIQWPFIQSCYYVSMNVKIASELSKL